jgi:hypothetical protein
MIQIEIPMVSSRIPNVYHNGYGLLFSVTSKPMISAASSGLVKQVRAIPISMAGKEYARR